MKILLVNPKIPYQFRMFDYADEEGRQAIRKRVLIGPPLGLNELAGMLPEEDIIILDQKAELDNNPNYNDEEDLAKVIADFQPDIVGYTCLTAQYNSLKKLLAIAKQWNQKVLTVVGGIHPTSCPEDFRDYDVDILVLGMGTTTFYRIVQEFTNNREEANYASIPGLAVKKASGGFHYTKPLGELSYEEFRKEHFCEKIIPNRSLTDRYNYLFPNLNLKVHYLSTSLGCTHRCNFCYLWKMTDGRYYHRDVEAIISELKGMDQYTIIRFCDSNTFGNVNKSRELFTRIIEAGLNHHLFFADVRTDTVIKHPDLFQLASRAGLKAAVCGLEATSNEELKRYEKENTIETIRDALKILNEAGINVNGNYIIRPDYDEADFERVARFVDDNPIFHSGFTILTPFPGTEQWDLLQDQIVIKDFDYYNLTNAVLKTKLPEKAFYERLTELYKVSGKATKKFHAIYGNNIPGNKHEN